MSRVAYVDGQYLPHRLAAVHIEDRGYQFADGVYEVLSVVGGRLVDEEPHLIRLARSLAELLDIMRREDYGFVERPFTVAEAKAASEAFLTSTTVDLLPVVRIDGDPVGGGVPGPLSRKLRERYLAHAAAVA